MKELSIKRALKRINTKLSIKKALKRINTNSAIYNEIILNP
jgi:hypothetical protein